MEQKFGRHNAKIQRQLSRPAPKLSASQDPAKIAATEQKKLSRAVQAEEKRAFREAERTNNYWANARQKSTLRNVQLEEKAQKKLHANAQRERQAQEQFVRATAGGAASRVWSGVKAVGAAGAATIGLSGAALAASSISQATRLDDIARRTAIQGRGVGSQGMDPNELRKQFSRTAIATGVSAEDVAAGVSKYVDRTGDLAGGVAHMKTFATMAQASGSNPEAVADTAFALSQAGVTSEDDTQKALSALYFQGKRGSFKLSDQATHMPQMIARGREFGVRGVEGITQLGGLAQITQNTTLDADKTATGIDKMFAELTSHAKEMASGKSFSGRKVDVYKNGDAKNGANGIRDILMDMFSASRGDSTQISKVFAKTGVLPIMGMRDEFKNTRLAALAGGASESEADKKARAATLKMWDASSATGGGNFKEVERDAADTMKGFGAQMENLNTMLKDAVSSELFPELVKMGPDLKELVPAVGKATRAFVELAKFLVQNPLIGIGGAIATSIAIDIAKAKLGDVVSKSIKGVINSGSKPGMGTSVTGVLGATASGVAIGGMIATAIFTAGVVNFENAEVNMKESGKSLNDVRDSYGIDDIGKVKSAVEEQRKKVEDAKKPGLFEGIDSFFSGPGDKKGGKLDKWADSLFNPNKATETKTQESFLAEMEKRLNSLEVLKEVADALAKSGVSQEDAAKQLSSAAEKLGLTNPNRGNAPSPVKP